MLILAAAVQATTLLAVPPCVPQEDPPTGPASSFRVDVAPGKTALETSLSVDTSADLVETRISQDGEETPAEMMGEMTRLESSVLEATWIDRALESDQGTAAGFQRTYEEVVSSSSFEMDFGGGGMGGMEPILEERLQEALVVGEDVVFRPDDDGWSPELADGTELEEEDIEGLVADVSLAFLSPGEEVEAGAEWEVPAAVLEDFAEPLGLLPFDEEAMGEEEGAIMLSAAAGDSSEEEAPEYEGSIAVRYAGTKEHDGRLVLELKLKGTCSSEVDTVMSVSFVNPESDDEVEAGEQELHIHTAYSVEGSALYDPELAQFVHVSIEIEAEVETASQMEFPTPTGETAQLEDVEVEEVSTVFELTRKQADG